MYTVPDTHLLQDPDGVRELAVHDAHLPPHLAYLLLNLGGVCQGGSGPGGGDLHGQVGQGLRLVGEDGPGDSLELGRQVVVHLPPGDGHQLRHLEDDLLHPKLYLPLGVHHRVGSVEEDLLHVSQALDLVLQLLVPSIHPLEEALGHAAGLHHHVLQLLGGGQDVALGGVQGRPQVHLSARLVLVGKQGLHAIDHCPRLVADKVDRLAGVVDVGGEEGDDVVGLLGQGLEDGRAPPGQGGQASGQCSTALPVPTAAALGQLLDLVVHPEQEGRDVVDLLLDTL